VLQEKYQLPSGIPFILTPQYLITLVSTFFNMPHILKSLKAAFSGPVTIIDQGQDACILNHCCRFPYDYDIDDMFCACGIQKIMNNNIKGEKK
jgi:hypothetical protein